jgi:hypothetical protein
VTVNHLVDGKDKASIRNGKCSFSMNAVEALEWKLYCNVCA